MPFLGGQGPRKSLWSIDHAVDAPSRVCPPVNNLSVAERSLSPGTAGVARQQPRIRNPIDSEKLTVLWAGSVLERAISAHQGHG